MTHSAPQAASSAAPTAVRSGAVGSMLEFYDFFIYTQAAALVFPTVFFPSSSPSMAIIASRVLAKVDGDEALVGVRHVEAEVLVVGVGGAEHGALGAAGIALGRLDLDDVGPPFAEDARDGGGGQECCHIDNRDAGKGVHGYLVAGEGEGSPLTVERPSTW